MVSGPDSCNLQIPFKNIVPDDPRMIEKMNENNKAIERWARHFRNNCLPTGGFEMSMAYFDRSATQSIPDAGAGTDFDLDSYQHVVGPDPAQLNGSSGHNQLEFLLTGIYIMIVRAKGADNASNQECELYYDALFGDGVSIGAPGQTPMEQSPTALTSRLTPHKMAVIGVDAGTLIDFGIRQTSGASRNYSLSGQILRVAPNDELWLAVS